MSVLCFIGAQYGYGAIMGAVLIGGLVEGILGLFAKFWLRIIAPIVSASVVTAIGFSLLTVGANSFGGGSGSEDFGSATNWILGSVTLLCCILFHIFAKSYFKQLSVLFGLIVGYILAICMGKVDFSALRETSIIAVPHLMPFRMEFHADAIISVVLIFLVSATETIGDTSALAASGLGRDVTREETSGSIACDGFVSSLSSVFGCLPITSFSQNVGLVAMTKVVNRFTIATGAVIMILGRHLSDFRRIAGDTAGCRSGRLYHYDVRYDCCQRLADDEQMRLFSAEHDYCGAVAEHRFGLYSVRRPVQYLPGYGEECLCTELCGSCIFGVHSAESGAAEKHGGRKGDGEEKDSRKSVMRFLF